MINGIVNRVGNYLRRSLIYLAVVGLILTVRPNSVSAFDTFWHFGMATEVGLRCGFSDDAVRVLQFSSFCMDYFGPFVTEVIGFVDKTLSYLELQNLATTGETHAASNFMHFDNLAGQPDRNWKFDYMWSRLLANTRKSISGFYADTSLKPDEQKRLILLTLGASLHMVEDFYSHSDWIHFDFAKMGFKPERTSAGDEHAPTWFEVRRKLGAPSMRGRSENWKFHVWSGIFPPVDSASRSTFGVPLSHTTMNHDNSQLFYSGASQIKYHGYGAYPAHDSASAAKHQSYAYHTACASAIEWITLLDEDPTAKRAIEFAKRWDMKQAGPDVADDLKDGIYSALMVSCLMKKWDGDKPPVARDTVCETFRILAHIHIPTMSNLFWGSFPKDSILQRLTLGIGDSTGHYIFDSHWVERHPMKRD
jgi:hypothetical protein